MPYPGISNAELPSKLKEGYRMSAPKHTPTEVNEIMHSCWLEGNNMFTMTWSLHKLTFYSLDPEQRPDFRTIYTKLNGLLKPSVLNVKQNTEEPERSAQYALSPGAIWCIG